MRTLICKIPPNLPFPKGGTIPLVGKAPFLFPLFGKALFYFPSLEKRGEGRFFYNVYSI